MRSGLPGRGGGGGCGVVPQSRKVPVPQAGGRSPAGSCRRRGTASSWCSAPGSWCSRTCGRPRLGSSRRAASTPPTSTSSTRCTPSSGTPSAPPRPGGCSTTYQPVVWREISIITSALRNDSQDKQTQFLRSLFETLPGRVQCEMLLKVTEQCFNTLERSEMLLLLLRRFPETVVQHGVGLGEALLEAETIEEQDSPVNCFRKLFVCDVLPLIINNHDVRLPANLLYKYLTKAAEFYINYVTRSTQIENQHQGAQETSDLMSPSKRSSQKYIIEGLTEKSSQIVDPWERLFKILNVVGVRCEWQMDKGRRSYSDILHRMKDLCRYMNNFDNEAHAKYRNQVVYSTMLVFFKNAFQYVNSIQPSLFQGPNAPSQVPLVLLEDVSNVYGDVEIDRNKHIHKKRKLAEGREKTMSSDDEDCSAKGRNRHIVVNKAELANSIEVLESFKLARESWELLSSLDSLDKEFTRICLAWKTDTWLWLRIFLTDMIIYQGQYKKAIASLHHLAALQGSLPQPQITGQGTLEHQRALIQLATCHFALGEYRAPHGHTGHHQGREGGLPPGHGAPGVPLWGEPDGSATQILRQREDLAPSDSGLTGGLSAGGSSEPCNFGGRQASSEKCCW
ncbi:integrator complex subunit 10 isoform X6 [Equus przewalskii]|uniref:Integrator complex subunit 10 n=1 Tax=Equus przewalskii TaxID=9798 RepID=A0ABM4MQ05_EQUPR